MIIDSALSLSPTLIAEMSTPDFFPPHPDLRRPKSLADPDYRQAQLPFLLFFLSFFLRFFFFFSCPSSFLSFIFPIYLVLFSPYLDHQPVSLTNLSNPEKKKS